MEPQNYVTKIFETNKNIQNSKDQETGTRRGCSGTINTGVTRKHDKPLKGIHNPAPQKPDNTLKGIRNIVPNGTRNQWKIWFTIQT